MKRTNEYPIRRAVCKTVTIPNTFRDINIEKLFSGQLLSRLVIGLVANAAFNCANNRNPFNFAHYNLMEVSVYTNGQQQYGMQPLSTDFTNSLYIRAYNTLFSGTGKIFKDEGNGISRTAFWEGNALYAFDLSPDFAEEDHFNLQKQSSVRLVLKFRQALNENVSVIAYAEFENVLEIEHNRNVIYDFSVWIQPNSTDWSVIMWSVLAEFSALTDCRRIRECWYLTLTHYCGGEGRDTNFVKNRTIGCEDIKIFFVFSRWRPPPSWNVEFTKLYWLTMSGGPRHIIVLNFIKIGRSISAILRFCKFSK